MPLLVKKNGMGCAIFTLISVNYHYCAMWQSLFWASFLNRILFFKFYFKNVNVAIFSYFESNFIDKLIWGNVSFLNFGHVTIFPKTKIRFLAFILKENILRFFLLIYSCLRCMLMWWKFRTKVPTRKYLKMVASKWTPLVQ